MIQTQSKLIFYEIDFQ